MTEQTVSSENNGNDRSKIYEYDEKIQTAIDAFIRLGTEVSSARIDSEELAIEIAGKVNEKLYTMAEDGVDIGQRMLRVSGPSVRKVNFKQIPDERTDNYSYLTIIDPAQPTRPLELFEEQLFRAKTVLCLPWEDEAAGCWRVGVKIHGDDPQSLMTMSITSPDGLPLLASRTQTFMTVACDEHAQIGVDSLMRKRDRDESIARLRGQHGGGIIRMLKAIDDEMAKYSSEQYTNLKHVQYLRVLGKYGLSLGESKKADLLNTAIGKVLSREDRIVVGGGSYEMNKDASEDALSYVTLSGVVADVIHSIPVATPEPVGPSLVIVGPYGAIDDPSYMPLKDVQTLSYVK